MNDNWSDFEKYVFDKLEKLDIRIGRLEARALVIATGASLFVTILLRVFV